MEVYKSSDLSVNTFCKEGFVVVVVVVFSFLTRLKDFSGNENNCFSLAKFIHISIQKRAFIIIKRVLERTLKTF